MKKLLTLKNGVSFYINNFYVTNKGDIILKNSHGIATFKNGHWKRLVVKK